MKTQFFTLKASLHFLAAAGAAFVAASPNPPTSPWSWSMLVVGAVTAGCVSLKAYLSDASSNL